MRIVTGREEPGAFFRNQSFLSNTRGKVLVRKSGGQINCLFVVRRNVEGWSTGDYTLMKKQWLCRRRNGSVEEAGAERGG